MLHTKSSFGTKTKTRTKKVMISDSKKHNFHTMKNSNLSLGIKRLPHSRMLKSEMADYVEKTIAIVEEHNLESVMIDPVFSLLQAKEPDVKLLRLSYGIDTMRLKANNLKADMMLQISAFKMKVRLLNRSNLALDLHVLQNAINNHLIYLTTCKNDKQLNQKVGGFFDIIDTNVDLISAIEKHDLMDDVDAMRMSYKIVNAAWDKRVKMLSERPNISTKVIIKRMSASINDLFKGIEMAHLLSALGEEAGGKTNFVPLIDELNQLSEMYYRSISIRDANNKRKALEEENSEGGIASAYAWTDNHDRNDDNDSGEVSVSSFRAMSAPAGPTSAIELPTDFTDDSDKESDKSIDHEKPF